MLVHVKGSAKTQVTKVDSEMEQMHTIDLRVAKIYKVSDSTLDLTNKQHRKVHPVLPNDKGEFFLTPGVYTFDTFHEVEMAEGEAAWIIGRSTLTRNGIIVSSALYDAGYKGGINGFIHNPIGSIKLKVADRIGQFIVTQAETIKLYEGTYNAKS